MVYNVTYRAPPGSAYDIELGPEQHERFPAGIPSTEAVGAPALTNLNTYLPAGIASTLAVGAPAFQLTNCLQPAGIALSGQVGAPNAVGPLNSIGVSSTLRHGRPEIFLIPSLSLIPDTGPAQGGTAIQVESGLIDMGVCSDGLDGAAISSLWSVSGSVTPRPREALYRFDTTLTTGFSASLRSMETVRDVDVQAQFQVDLTNTGRGAAELVLASLALYIPVGGGSRSIQLQLIQTRQRQRVVRLNTVDDSGTLPGVEKALFATQTIQTSVVRFRLLRVAGNVYCYVGRSLLGVVSWGTGDAEIRLRVANDTVNSSRAVTLLTDYVRQAVVSFGGVPLQDFRLVSRFRAVGSTPAVPCEYDLTDVQVTGCNQNTETLAEAFTFTRDPDLIQWDAANGALIVCNDPILKRSRF